MEPRWISPASLVTVYLELFEAGLAAGWPFLWPGLLQLGPGLTPALGTDGDDILVAGLSTPILQGGAGNDLLLSLGGNHRLFGDEDNDWLFGGQGQDFLDGGPGRNWLFGGGGTDIFVLKPDGRIDTLLDFNPALDRLQLQGGLTPTQLAISQQGPHTTLRYLGEAEPTVVLLNLEATRLTPEVFQTTALAPTFSGLTIFGDSLSDPGNLFALTGFFPPPPYAQGRFSNGAIWVDNLAASLDLEQSQILNFALGGATTGRDNGLDPLFQALTGTDPNLPGLLDEIDQYLSGLGTAPTDPESLYVVWAGANDLFNLPSDPNAIPGFLATAVNNVATALTRLAQQGADTFLVPNLPNLGLTPRALGSGSGPQATALSQQFNAGLAQALTALEQSPTFDLDIIEIDLFALTTEVLSTPEAFGFTNGTDPLINQGGLNDPGFFWWDQQHPTTVTHGLIADSFQRILFEAGYLVPLTESVEVGDRPLAAAPVASLAGALEPVPIWPPLPIPDLSPQSTGF